jgi:hypothetical protein
MTPEETWWEAFRLFDDGRTDALADLVESGVIPVFALQGLAARVRKARVKNTGRPPEPRNADGNTSMRENQVRAYARFHRLLPTHGEEESLRRAATRDVPETRLRLIVQNKVKPVNDILKARGLFVTGIRFSEAFKN